jgi:hypothetical protein
VTPPFPPPGNYGSPPPGVKPVCDRGTTTTGKSAWLTYTQKTDLTPVSGSRSWRRSWEWGEVWHGTTGQATPAKPGPINALSCRFARLMIWRTRDFRKRLAFDSINGPLYDLQ